MKRDLTEALAASAAIDWPALYQEYVATGLSLIKYYNEYFVDFCIRCGVDNYILSFKTLCKHVRFEREKMADSGLEQDVQTTGQNQSSEIDTDSNLSQVSDDIPHPQKSDCTDVPSSDAVAVYDLEEILSNAGVISASKTPIDVSSLIPPIKAERASAIPPRCLITEFNGIKFTISCRDPTEALASLLVCLTHKPGAKHAH